MGFLRWAGTVAALTGGALALVLVLGALDQALLALAVWAGLTLAWSILIVMRQRGRRDDDRGEGRSG